MGSCIKYVTNADVCDIVRNGLRRVPRDIDGVIGLLPGGVLAASVVSCALGKPVYSAGAFAEGLGTYPDRLPRVYRGGSHGRYLAVSLSPDDAGFDRVSAAVSAAGAELTSAVVCGNPGCADIVLSQDSGITVFEADFFRSHWVSECVFAIDGVLCEDPGLSIESDEDAYIGFMKNAVPLVSAVHSFKAVCTSRLLKYSAPTKEWLLGNGFSYGMMWMLDFKDYDEKLAKLGKPEYLGMKTKVYRKYPDALMFVEGRWDDALRIHKDTRRPVLCVSRNILLQDE